MNYKRLVVGLSLAAGILYNSWPLGYWLDSATTRHGLASDLELAGHPYYWVFILGDVLTAACIIAAVIIVRWKLWPSQYVGPVTMVQGGLLVFGVFTAASAILSYNIRFGVDVVTSTLAALGLFISLSVLVVTHWKNKPILLSRITQAVWAAWTTSGLLFAVLALTNGKAHYPQDILLIISGLAVATIGLNLVATIPS